MKNPCMGCPKAGCGSYHDICPDYQAYRDERFKEYERRRKISDLRADLSSNTKRHIRISKHFYKKP